MRRILTTLTILTLIIVPQLASADDVDDLKATNKKVFKLSWSTDPKDLEAFADSVCDEILWMDAEYAFPFTMTKEELKQSKMEWYSKGEYCEWIEQKSIYRVVGNTGFVYEYGTEIKKYKDNPEVIRNIRNSFIYLKIKGKWLFYSGHVSRIPSGN